MGDLYKEPCNGFSIEDVGDKDTEPDKWKGCCSFCHHEIYIRDDNIRTIVRVDVRGDSIQHCIVTDILSRQGVSQILFKYMKEIGDDLLYKLRDFGHVEYPVTRYLRITCNGDSLFDAFRVLIIFEKIKKV